jgi:uncharacterized protein GlcG (DUF336 family)
MPKQVTLEAAERIIGECKRKAGEMGQPVCIAVADGGANLVAFVRMDDSLLVAAEIAQKKALTAVEFQMDTRQLTPLVQPGAPLYGIVPATGGRLVVFGGGTPLIDTDGRVVGGSASAAAASSRTRTWPWPAPRRSEVRRAEEDGWMGTTARWC